MNEPHPQDSQRDTPPGDLAKVDAAADPIDEPKPIDRKQLRTDHPATFAEFLTAMHRYVFHVRGQGTLPAIINPTEKSSLSWTLIRAQADAGISP